MAKAMQGRALSSKTFVKLGKIKVKLSTLGVGVPKFSIPKPKVYPHHTNNIV